MGEMCNHRNVYQEWYQYDYTADESNPKKRYISVVNNYIVNTSKTIRLFLDTSNHSITELRGRGVRSVKIHIIVVSFAKAGVKC